MRGRFWSAPRVVFYIEAPFQQFCPRGGHAIGHNYPVTSDHRDAFFVTPGLRYHFNVKRRFAVHAAVGGGIAVREQEVTTQVGNPGTSSQVHTGWRGSPAYDLGAGVDFRLTRLLSLRGELRRFRTTDQGGFGDGKTYPSVNIGLALHF